MTGSNDMRLQFLGSGDAFGSGGRFNTCFLIDRGESSFLIDCGASTLIAMRRFGVDPNRVSAIVLSHLHADHFGGLPSFILDAQFVSRRIRPLTVIGPEGLRTRLEALMEAHFPGSSQASRKFEVKLIELLPEASVTLDPPGATVTGFTVLHPSGTPSLALRIECDGKVLAYSGDTEWVDALIKAGHSADLLIAECYTYDRQVRFHLNYVTLVEKLPLIAAKRVVLTHLSQEMLARTDSISDFEVASDGHVIMLQ
jgi:ribonuclease BN (tRNA processing enzyme)